jgi:hypothetical protein
MSTEQAVSSPEPDEVVVQTLHEFGDESVTKQLNTIEEMVANEEKLRWSLAQYVAEVSVEEEYSDQEEENAKQLFKEARNQGIGVQTADIAACQKDLIQQQAKEEASTEEQGPFSDQEPTAQSPTAKPKEDKDTPDDGPEKAEPSRTNPASDDEEQDQPSRDVESSKRDLEHPVTSSLAAFSREVQTEARPSPEDLYDTFERLTKESRNSQDKIGVDRIRDDGILVRDDEFIGIAKIDPRNWFVLNEGEKEAVFTAYVQHLLALTFPVQEVVISRDFDLSEHQEKLTKADIRDRRASPILRHSRQKEAFFEMNAIEERNIKRNEYYIVVSVTKDHIADESGESQNNRLPRVSKALRFFADRVNTGRDKTEISDEECVKEVNARFRHVEDTLSKTGVNVDPIDNRDDAMDLVYRVLNGVESPFDEYNQSHYVDTIKSYENTI